MQTKEEEKTGGRGGEGRRDRDLASRAREMRERDSHRRGPATSHELGRGKGRDDRKEQRKSEMDERHRGRWPTQERDSSSEVGEIELARGRRNDSSEERRVRAKRETEGDADLGRVQDYRRRGMLRKEREYSSDEERVNKKRIDGVVVAGNRAFRRDMSADLGLARDRSADGDERAGKTSSGRLRAMGGEVPPRPSLARVAKQGREEESDPRIDDVNDVAKRGASPSPKAKAYFSASESGRSDSSRSARPDVSSTPERASLSKPPRATPDIRRGLRSPNPSPVSPRIRLPPPGVLSPLFPAIVNDELLPSKVNEIVTPSLVEEISAGDGEGIHSRPLLALNGGEDDAKYNEYRKGSETDADAKLKSPQNTVDDTDKAGDSFDRWMPDYDDEEFVDYRGGSGNASPVVTADDRYLGSSPRESDQNDRDKRDSDRRGRGQRRMYHHRGKDESRYGGIRRGVDNYGRQIHGVDDIHSRRGRNNDSYWQPSAEYFENRDIHWERDEVGHDHNGEPVKSQDSGRMKELKQTENGRLVTRFRREEAMIVAAEKGGSVPEIKRERPQLPLGRSGGVYIPPFKLAQMLKEVEDKSSNEYQRLTWDALRKSINGLVNKVNASNLKNILPELFSENLIRGRGLFARSCMKSQMASPTFTHIFAAVVAVVNTKFPELGELLLKRIILQLRRAFKRNDKPVLLAAAKFIAHLVNQQVAHEILALELLTVLLENPTDDSVEVAVGFVKECGAVLQNLSSQGLHGIFERFRGILHEGEIDKRVQFMIEGLFAIRKAKFQGFAGVLPELDLVEEEDQITHELSLEDELDDESYLDVFKPDLNFVENEKKYEVIKKEILGDELDEEVEEDGDKGSEEEDEDEEEEEDEDEREQRMQIQDETETNLVNLRRTIYLTIMSSVDFEEAGHKLLKIKLEPGQEMELCIMLLECCSQERTYLRYYGLLGQRFCLINRVYQENFDQCFVKQYSMIHRLETNKLRNVAKFFAHLVGTDALPWQALAYIRLTEEDTTSSSRIFIKILFQELSEHLGLRRLNERLSDPMMQESFDGIFPKDNPKNTRFAINFFTSIGLGGLTDSLREYLKNMPRLIMQQHRAMPSESEDSSSSESSDESDSDSSMESDTVSDDSDSDSEDRKRSKK